VATIEPRTSERYPDGYRVRWRTLDGKAASWQCESKREAEGVRERIEDSHRAVRRGVPGAVEFDPRAIAAATAAAPPAAPVKRATLLSQVAEDYVLELEATRERATAKKNASLLEHFLGWMEARHGEGVTVAELTRAGLEAYRNSRIGVDAPGTIVGRFSTINTFWSYAAERCGEAESPYVGVPNVKTIEVRRPVESEPVTPTWAEIDAVLAELEGDPWRVSFVCRYTGLRVDQALSLRGEDFDLEAARLRVRPELGKTPAEKRGRTVPISRHLVAEMAGWGLRSGLLFASPKDPTVPLSYSSVYNALAGRTAYKGKTRYHVAGAWERAEAAGLVRPAAWRAIGRGNAKPNHAFRGCLQTELTAAKPELWEAIDWLVGHKIAGVRGAYVASRAFEGVCRELVELIPPVGGVVALRRRAPP
jgi:integrase